MNLKTSFGLKFLAGGFAGMIISVIVCFLLEDAEYIDSHGLEMLRQLAGSFLYGGIAMGGSITYEIESWGIVKATAIHYIVTMSSFLVTNYVLGWFGTGNGLAFAFAGFTIGYIIIWLIQSLTYAKQVREVNERLKLLSDYSDKEDRAA